VLFAGRGDKLESAKEGGKSVNGVFGPVEAEGRKPISSRCQQLLPKNPVTELPTNIHGYGLRAYAMSGG